MIIISHLALILIFSFGIDNRSIFFGLIIYLVYIFYGKRLGYTLQLVSSIFRKRMLGEILIWIFISSLSFILFFQSLILYFSEVPIIDDLLSFYIPSIPSFLTSLLIVGVLFLASKNWESIIDLTNKIRAYFGQSKKWKLSKIPDSLIKMLLMLTGVVIILFYYGYNFSLGLYIPFLLTFILIYIVKGQAIKSRSNTYWTWKSLRQNWWSGFIKGSIFMIVFLLIIISSDKHTPYFPSKIFPQDLQDLDLLTKFSLFGILGGLIGIILSGWKAKILKENVKPNMGMRMTFNSTIKGFFIGLIISFLLDFLLTHLFDGSYMFRIVEFFVLFKKVNLVISEKFLGGFIGWLWFGGFDLIKHYTLRFIIYLSGNGPLKYATFLDYASKDLHFMQKVGGGYMFIHRKLLDHFADMEQKE